MFYLRWLVYALVVLGVILGILTALGVFVNLLGPYLTIIVVSGGAFVLFISYDLAKGASVSKASSKKSLQGFTEKSLYRKGATSTTVAHGDSSGYFKTDTIEYKDVLHYNDFPWVAQSKVTFREWSEYWESRGKKITLNEQTNDYEVR